MPLAVPFAIRAQRAVVVGAGDEIAPMRVRNLAAGDRLEVEDVQRFRGGRDELGILRLLGCLLEPLEIDPGGGEKWASGQIAKEAAAGEFVGGHERKRTARVLGARGWQIVICLVVSGA